MNITTASPQETAESIISTGYPALFDLAHELSRAAAMLKDGCNTNLLQLAENIHTELDECYRKEKLVLFPYVEQLWKTAQKSETCAPFKNVKQHYTKMLALLSRMKAEALASEDDTVIAINNFEKELIRLQLIKERELFAPFRSCTGCRLA